MKSWDTLAHYIYICNISRFHFNHLLTIVHIEICLLSFIEILFSELHNKQTVYITIKQIVLARITILCIRIKRKIICML